MQIEKIRSKCLERGISIRRLEMDLGFGNGTIATWDRKVPSVMKVKAVADYFGVTVDELLAENDTEDPAPEGG